MSVERVAPQNLEAEESVLGAMMFAGAQGPEVSAATIARVQAEGLEPGDFFLESHRIVYEAALEVAGRSEPTDALAIRAALSLSGRLDDVSGGAARLHELAALVPAIANVGHYARLVVDESERREEFYANVALGEAVRNGGLAANPDVRERVARLLEPRRGRVDEQIAFVTFEEFVSRPEPQAEPLVLDAEGGTAVSATGLGMAYGTGGAGKTTLWLDGALHFAAGEEWLDGAVVPVRKLRVGWIENEGPREEFRRKLERKLAAWRGRVKRDRLRLLDRPWSKYDLRRADHREALAREVTDADVDLLIVGPLHRLGMEGGGTPDEVRAFTALIEDVQERAGRPVFVLVIHHDNRAGQVSGAWEGVPDLLVHVTAQGNGRTRVFWQKARWSSSLHATAVTLTWTDDEGFAVEEKPELDDETIAERITTVIADNPGTGWTPVEERTPGIARGRRRHVRDDLLRSGKLVNVVTNEAGEKVLLDHCPERRPARLYPADDPTIRHLRPDPGAGAAQAAPAGGEGASAPLRRAPRPKGGAGAAAQMDTPVLVEDEA